ncbi:MAG: dihydrodipicolinate synthase family protein [Micrococcaceae bacterium]
MTIFSGADTTTSMLSGLSAFPLTPLRDDRVDEDCFAGLIDRLVAAGVDSITALGSTGSGAYLSTQERGRVARIAVERAEAIPVLVGVSDLRTSRVLEHVHRAEEAGAAGVLLAPMSYQPLTEDDVVGLYRAVTERTALPVVVYDNPVTTHFTFTRELYARLAELPGIASIKIPGVPIDPEQAREHVTGIRAVLPERLSLGVSGDAFASAGLAAGCETWYSVIGGTLPAVALELTRAAQREDHAAAEVVSQRLAPLWQLFAELGGSLRVTAAIAEHLGLVPPRCLPLPLQGLSDSQRERVVAVVNALDIAEGT